MPTATRERVADPDDDVATTLGGLSDEQITQLLLRHDPQMRPEEAHLTDEQRLLRAIYLDDPVMFINDCCKIVSDVGNGIVPFRLYPYQKYTLRCFLRWRENVILKARQLGISELVAAYTIWFLQRPNRTALFLSKGEAEADELLFKARICWENLPDWLRIPARDSTKTSSLILANGSRIIPKPTTKGAGRTFNAQLLVFDEWAHQRFQEEIFAAAVPTARSARNQIIGISTANGDGDVFARQYHLAREGKGMHPIFLPWHVRPGRDASWYEQATAGMEKHQKAQEYPTTEEEAFAVSGRPRFDVDALNDLAGRVRPPVLTGLDGCLKVWERPQHGARYVCGVDTAEGLKSGDLDAAVILDVDTGVEVAVLHGRWETHVFAKHIVELCKIYRYAFLGIERNNHGHAVLQEIIVHLRYPHHRTYYHREYDEAGLGEATRPGWHTSTRSKPIMIGMLAQTFLEHRPWRNFDMLAEAKTYVRKVDGSTGAGGQLHDDLVMATAIAEQMRHYTPPHTEIVTLDQLTGEDYRVRLGKTHPRRQLPGLGARA